MLDLSIWGLSTFPLKGQFREPMLILEGLVIFLCIQYGIFFLYKFSKEEKEKNFMIRAWGIFFIALSGMILFFIISDFYSQSSDIRQIYVDFGYMSAGFGALFFSYNAEYEIKQKNHIFTKFLILLLSLLIVDIFLQIVTPSIFAMSCWVPFIIILFIYLIKFTSKIKEKWRLNIYGFIVGFFFWGIGYGLEIDFLVKALGSISRFIGDISMIIGISLISLIYQLPSLNEFEWPKKMKKLFIMHKSGGAYIADYDFQENLADKSKSVDLSQLITDGLKGIEGLITEIIQSDQKLKIMDHKDLKIMFEYGNYLIAAIIVEEELDIYRTKLKKLINYLETLYESLLPNWDGEVSQFEIVKPIIRRFFSG